MTTTAPTNTDSGSSDRATPRVMLSAIALATDLPVPQVIDFHPGGQILSLRLGSIAEGQAWSRYLGGQTRTYVNTDARRYLDEGRIYWHGWRVQLHATDPAAPDEALDPDTTTALTRITNGSLEVDR